MANILNKVTVLLLVFGFFTAGAQNIKVSLGPSEIALNEYYSITIRVDNDNLKEYSPFPDIKGFKKRGTSSSSSHSFVNGVMSVSNSITQNYVAEKEGTYTIKPFEIKVNGNVIKNNGGTVKVVAPRQQQQNDPFGMDPFADFFGRGKQPQEFIDIKEDAFFELTTDKRSVYVGEGLNVTLAFYISKNNRAQMQFHEVGRQLMEILKKMKPANCWEENFMIEEIVPEEVEINGKAYTQYKLYRATYFPLNSNNIKFEALPLKMIKYKVAKLKSFFGNNYSEDFKTFYSTPKIIKVKELPPHPLKDQVAVGNYVMKEKLGTKKITTGNSFNYTFEVEGEGNISAITPPVVVSGDSLEIYDPNINHNINRGNGRVTGKKSFSYYAIANEPGKYKLDKYLYFVYFNPIKAAYDTLKPRITLEVTGSKNNLITAESQNDNFYARISKEDNTLISVEQREKVKKYANIAVLILFAIAIILFFKK